MKRALIALTATTILSSGLTTAALAGPLTDLMNRKVEYVKVGGLNPPTEGNYLPEHYREKIVLSGLYCEGLPYHAYYYHVNLEVDDVDDSGGNSQFRAFAYVELSNNKSSLDEPIATHPYIVTGEYLDGTIHIETAKPVFKMDDEQQLLPILEATPGNYQVRMYTQGRTESSHLHISKPPEGASCFSAQIATGDRLTKKGRKELVAAAKKNQKNREQQATAPTMFFDTIQISGKQPRKKVEKQLLNIGAKSLESATEGVDTTTRYDVSKTIPGISELAVVFTSVNGKEYLKHVSLEIVAKPNGTPREELPVVQIRNSLVQKYGTPTQEFKNGDAAWIRHDEVLIAFKVKGGALYVPASGEIHYINKEIAGLSKKLNSKHKKATYNKF